MMEKKIRKILMMIFDIENWLWKSNFGTFMKNSCSNWLISLMAIDLLLLWIPYAFKFLISYSTALHKTVQLLLSRTPISVYPWHKFLPIVYVWIKIYENEWTRDENTSLPYLWPQLSVHYLGLFIKKTLPLLVGEKWKWLQHT